MSADLQTGEALPETAVRNPSRFASTLHRPAEGEGLRPACQEGDIRDGADWKLVDVAAYRSHYDLCGNPGCFGGASP